MYKPDERKGQTSVILILFIIVIFGGLAVFLLTFAKTFGQPEYMNLYTHNLLLSVMRTDTGYTDSRCRLVSDTMSCAFFESDWRCGGNGPRCRSLINTTITGYISEFELIQKSYRYLLIAKPEYLSGGEVINPVTNQPLRIKIGDLSLEEERVNKIVANEQIQKTTSSGPIIIKVQLILSQKKD
ncbi:MAG: hypothetical protein DRO99_04075 [Candidatus Aenigmatarchaeota archaeon]|mgnify:CR=1 FL=1|nr:MAG: hypothetical protein DRO99_04075 [Candidatus Aenigmarchaeota archaeon]